MEVFATWQLGEMVARLMNLSARAALSFASVLLALRIFVEIFKSYTFYKLRFTIPQFVPILLIIIALLSYTEIIPMIGDAFFGLADYIRGEAELTFRLTNIWEALKSKLGIEGEEQSMWDLVKNWAGFISDGTNPFDWIQDWWGLATAMSWQALGILIRAGMIVFKNIVYAYMLIVGPIPLVLSLIPGFQGMAAHWMKNFIVVCYWNVTIGLLDAIMQALNVQILADIAFGGDEEMTIGLLTAFSAIMYFFMPYLSSLAIGQTVVAMAGSKMVMAPLATALGITRLAASGGSSAGAKAVKSATSSSSKSAVTGGGAGEGRNPAGLLTMGTQRSPDVQTAYAAAPIRSRSATAAGTSGPSRVFYASGGSSRIPGERSLGGKQPPRLQPHFSLPQTAPRVVPPIPRKPKYLLGPKTTANTDGKD